MSAGTYSISGEAIMARARTIASQTMTDSNQSQIIDAKGGLRALLNDTIRILYRARARADAKFRHDVNSTVTATIVGGEGDVPVGIMREFLKQADITDSDSSLITYLDYSTDLNQTFNQLGYLYIITDTFHYQAPAPVLDTYSGDLTIQVPSFPDFPASMSQDIVFPSGDVIDDLCSLLAQAILGKVELAI